MLVEKAMLRARLLVHTMPSPQGLYKTCLDDLMSHAMLSPRMLLNDGRKGLSGSQLLHPLVTPADMLFNAAYLFGRDRSVRAGP